MNRDADRDVHRAGRRNTGRNRHTDGANQSDGDGDRAKDALKHTDSRNKDN